MDDLEVPNLFKKSLQRKKDIGKKSIKIQLKGVTEG